MADKIPADVAQVLMQHVGGSETGIAVIAADDRFLYCNASFIAMFGLEDHSPLGRTHDELVTWMFTHRLGSCLGNATLEQWLAQ